MLIGQCADEIIAELGYSEVSKQLDRRNVLVRMDAVRNEIMSLLAYDGVVFNGQLQIKIDRTASDLPDIYYVSKTTPVTFDTVRARFTSKMPTEYVSFGNVNGIRQIKATQDNTGGYFIGQTAGASSAFGLLESAQLAGSIGYELEGQDIYYNNMPANQFKQVLVTYIPRLSGLKEEDIMPCSAEIESLILNRTKESFLLQRQIPPDTVIDNVPR